ncbi:MAG: TIGR00269 family protein [Nitrososphaerales archaeon]
MTAVTELSTKRACRCGGKTVYFRAYNGESLCANCFNDSIIEKVKKAISKYDMLHYGDSVGVALSGGKDSTSLLYIMSKITEGHGTKLSALTIDEGIEGYRDEAMRNAKALCEKLSVPLIICSYKEFFGHTLDSTLEERDKKGVKTSSCAICGPLRRRSIDRAAEKLGVNVVATAHNLDDALQTFFINLYSGDVERIRWLDPGFHASNTFKLRRIKPMIEIYEQEIAFFAYLNGLPFQSESCPYMNEGIRTEIRNNLNQLESKHPGIKYSTLKTVLGIASGLDVSKKKKATICENCGSVSTGPLCSVCLTLKLVSPSP